MELNKIYNGNSLEILKTFPDNSIDCVITSPPYYALRDYGINGQLGLETTIEEYIDKLCNIFDEVKRVLKNTGTCWVNLGDTYGGSGDKGSYKDPKYPNGRNGQSIAINKNYTSKCLLQIPSRFAIEMCNRGWILRNEIIWRKNNCMPSSANDRFTVDFEKIFFFVKKQKYYFKQQYEPFVENSDMKYRVSLRCGRKYGTKRPYKDNQPLSYHNKPIDTSNGRNKRCVWDINTKPFKDAHFAVFPEKLVQPMILSGSPTNGIVLDIFMGSGTTAVVSKRYERNYVGIELNPEYIKIAEKRLKEVQSQLFIS